MAKTALFDRLGWSPRERKLATVAAGVAGVMVFLAGPVGVEAWLRGKKGDYDATRSALAAVQGARSSVRERQSKKDAITSRYARRAPQLAGFLEQTATTQKIQVADSVDRPEQPHGKRYNERNTVIHFKKTGMLPLAKFLEAVERSGFPVAVTRLNLRTRAGEKDSYDVEVGVSAYDRTEAPAKEPTPAATTTAKETP